MARKPRWEFAGAHYHVISRGNYRKPLFTMDGSGAAFEKALFEVAERCGWKLHAYVVMGNHYHLALETPEPNLVEGMKWLQSTFANRFNRFHGETGHVFQGRYKSLILEPGTPLLQCVNYIHLNPVRAGILSLETLKDYRPGSFHHFRKKRVLPEWLVRSSFLRELGLPDSLNGMKLYQKHLEESDACDPAKKAELSKQFIRGWAIASKAYRKEVLERFQEEQEAGDWGGIELKEFRESKWERFVLEALAGRKKSEADLANSQKAADWKVEIARELRAKTTATNPWIANRLRMGHPSRVSNLVNKQI